MPSSKNYKRDYKDGRAGRKIKKTYSKTCPECGINFTGIAKQKYCSPKCKGKVKYSSGKITTEYQYKQISGNWKKYFQRLVNQHNRNELTIEICLELLEEQKSKCAISGIELTCQLEIGKRFLTNVSIDRIEAGGPYTKDNVQLVCTALNSWRGDTPLEEFIWWCKQVAEYQEKEDNDHA